MNLIIKGERRCVGCNTLGYVDLEVNKIEAGLMFVDWNDFHCPDGWVQPREWDDKRLQRRNSWKEVNHKHVFCSAECMYLHYGAE